MRVQTQDVKAGPAALTERKDGFPKKALGEGLRERVLEKPEGWVGKNEAMARFGITRKQFLELVKEGNVEVLQSGAYTWYYNAAQMEKAVLEKGIVPWPGGEMPEGWLRAHEAAEKYHVGVKTFAKLEKEGKVERRLCHVRYAHDQKTIRTAAYWYNGSQIEKALEENPALLEEKKASKTNARGRPPKSRQDFPESDKTAGRGRPRKNLAGPELHKKILAAARIGLSNTRKEFRENFSENVLRPLWKALKKAFDGDAVRALEAVMGAKRVERTESYPKPKKEHWEKIMEEVRECIRLMEAAEEKKLELVLGEQHGFSRCDGKTNGQFAMERELLDTDGRPVAVRVWGRRPRVLSFYQNGEFALRSSLRFGHHASRKLRAVERDMGEGVLDVLEFEESIRQRLMNHVGMGGSALEAV